MLARYIVLSAQLAWKDIFRLELNDIQRGRNIRTHERVSKCSLYAFSTFWGSPHRLYAFFLLILWVSPVYLSVRVPS